jgi:uncharacterized protein YecE (DUF72 family)
VWQLSKRLVFDEERISGFLELLPRDTEQAARLARRHDRRVAGRSWTRTRRKRRLRHALEVRNETYFVPELVRLLRRHRVALVVSDAADWPLVEEVTAPFVYLRLHGSRRTYGSSYSDGEIARWAERIGRWAAGSEPADAARIAEEPTKRAAVAASPIDGGRPRAGSRAKEGARSRDVYVYFDNDWHANAPRDALRLLAKLGLERECAPGPGTRRPTIRP